MKRFVEMPRAQDVERDEVKDFERHGAESVGRDGDKDIPLLGQATR